jgi:hypothetical protein
MNLKTCIMQVVAGGAIALFVAACSPSASPEAAPALPESQSTAAATPVPVEAIRTAQQFAAAQAQIETDWDGYHQEFDRWRAGLTSCSRASAEEAFRGFASDASAISVQAGDLPRWADVRDLADKLVDAAGAEEAVLRRLRDRWQPGNTALFEEVEEHRSMSISAQLAVADGLEDLTHVDPESSDVIEEIAEEFETIGPDWKAVQEGYAELRDGQDNLTKEETIAGLGDLLGKIGKLREAIEELPSSVVTDRLIEDLLDALDEQVEALQALQGALESTADSSPAVPTVVPTAEPKPNAPPTITIAPPEPPESPEGENGDGDKAPEPGPGGKNGDADKAPEPTPGDDNGVSFEDADDSADEFYEVLNEVWHKIDEILEDPSAGLDVDLEKVEEFDREYLTLVKAWDKFHAGYGRWRATDGGCDRAEVSGELAGFSETLTVLAGQVRSLPRASYLRPMGNSLIEAVQGEQDAMRVLGYNWRPFSTDAFRAFDLERSSSRELRRQTEVGVQELLTRFGSG